MNDLCSQVQFNSSTLFPMMQHYHLRQFVCWYLKSQWTMWSEQAPLGYLPPKAGVRSQAMRYATKDDGKLISQHPSNCQRQAVLKRKWQVFKLDWLQELQPGNTLLQIVTWWKAQSTAGTDRNLRIPGTYRCDTGDLKQTPSNHWWSETKPTAGLKPSLMREALQSPSKQRSHIVEVKLPLSLPPLKSWEIQELWQEWSSGFCNTKAPLPLDLAPSS